MSARKMRRVLRFSSLSTSVLMFGLLVLLSLATKMVDAGHLVQFIHNNSREVAWFLLATFCILFEEKLLLFARPGSEKKRWLVVLLVGSFISFSAVANASTFGPVANFIWEGYFCAILALMVTAVGLLELSEKCRC